jgi:hypothetical protein
MSKNMLFLAENIIIKAKKTMAQLNNDTKAKVLNLVGQLLEWIDESKRIEMAIIEIYGENDATIIILDLLQKSSERLR